MSAGLEVHGLDELDASFKKLLDSREALRRQFHEQVANIAKAEVDSQIAGTVNDVRGRIRSWQEKYIGSGGGYVAIRPRKGETGKNSPGAITGYLEEGHRIRGPGIRGGTRHIKVAYVDGRHFYQLAGAGLESKVLAMANEYADKLARILEGGGSP